MAKETDISKIGTEILAVTDENIRPMFYVIRGQQVMLDADLALIYGYSTKMFNLQVKNNIEKFPEDFMFQLTNQEVANLRLKISTANFNKKRYNPHAFTEQGIYMQGNDYISRDRCEGLSPTNRHGFEQRYTYFTLTPTKKPNNG